MRVHLLQHVPFEGLGNIRAWLDARGATITRTAFYSDPRLPDLREIDWLIAMGGPMSVNDEQALPWLVAEKRFIADAIAASKCVLGVCLGAQLIASALGAKVFPNREKEIGWFPVEPTREAAASPFAAVFASPIEAFHWHGQTFELPDAATHLARSAGCEHQAFSIGDRVLGLQFHLDTTVESARALIEACPSDLVPGRFVHSADEMLRDGQRFDRMQAPLNALLDRLHAAWANRRDERSD